MPLYGWADLDEANKADGHYNRRPAWLTNACDKLRDLEKREIVICDQYEIGQATITDIKAIQTQIEQAQTEYARLWEFWNASVYGGITHNITIPLPKEEMSNVEQMATE